ncbi:hypothetical protein KY359_05340 [Candidatus Woesearchaeota archaeon]|nr:hypothetical protein [Candidatus Woesearchaeota archaeon]
MAVKVKKEDFAEMREKAAKEPLLSKISSMFTRRSELSHRRNIFLKQRLEKAGVDVSAPKASKLMLVACVIVNIFITLYSVRRFYGDFGDNYLFLFLALVFIWVFIFVIVLLCCGSCST